jgi:hypothetical protein
VPSGFATNGHRSAAVNAQTSIVFEKITVKVGKTKKKRLDVLVSFADTGAKKSEFASPFQSPPFKNIQVSVRDTNGDGVADEVVVTAKKGKKTLTDLFPG